MRFVLRPLHITICVATGNMCSATENHRNKILDSFPGHNTDRPALMLFVECTHCIMEDHE